MEEFILFLNDYIPPDVAKRLLIAIALLYFVPSLAAFVRSHRKAIHILGCNILLGWTIIGWFGLCFWALNGQNAKLGSDC